MQKLEQYEVDFIRETYLNPKLAVKEICEKLERSNSIVRRYASSMGLVRQNGRPRILDWPAIWYAYAPNKSYSEAGRALGISGSAVAHAVQAMILMGTERRLALWNRYADLHGRERYTFEEANGMV